MKKSRIAFALCLLFWLPAGTDCAVADEQRARVDEILGYFDSTHRPGVAVAVVRRGKVLYKKAFGMASLELGVPNTPHTLFRLGSVSKQFTAACIFLLNREGKLSLEDPLVKYFPEMPAGVYGGVRLRHLIHHTSGIRDSEALYPVLGMEYSQWYTHDQLLELLARQEALDFSPGERIEYSNSAYTLLALIVERVTDQKFADFARERIFQPLGMENTRIQTRYDTLIPGRAGGYHRVGEAYGNWMTHNQLVGHDAVYSSVEDMTYWIGAFFDDSLGRELMDDLTARTAFNDGSPNHYSGGIVVDHYQGLPAYSHSGWYVGYLAFLVIFPEQQLSIIYLSNVTEGSPSEKSLRIAEVYLEKEMSESLARLRARSKPADPRLLKNLPGDYAGIDYGGRYTLEVADGRPRLEGAGWDFEPSPFRKNEFINYRRRLRIRILSSLTGEDVFTIELLNSMGSMGRFQKLQPFSLMEDQLPEYCGKYFSPELQAGATVSLRQGRLFLQAGRVQGPLQPWKKDAFQGFGGILELIRDDDGPVRGFHLTQYGYRDIIFLKK